MVSEYISMSILAHLCGVVDNPTYSSDITVGFIKRMSSVMRLEALRTVAKMGFFIQNSFDNVIGLAGLEANGRHTLI